MEITVIPRKIHEDLMWWYRNVLRGKEITLAKTTLNINPESKRSRTPKNDGSTAIGVTCV